MNREEFGRFFAYVCTPILLIFVLALLLSWPNKDVSKQQTLTISSSAFVNNDFIPIRYTCFGDNVSPPLKISSPPKNTKSLVLIMQDPDAPGNNWLHWLAWNIPPSTTEILEDTGSLASSSIARNDFGNAAYGGPCSKDPKPHRYFFEVYALNNTLDMPLNADRNAIQQAMKGHILTQAKLVGIFGANLDKIQY